MALIVGTSEALAYQSGTIGYDISYPQCGTTYPTSAGSFLTAPPPAPAITWRGRMAVPAAALRSPTTPAARTAPVPQGVSGGVSRGVGLIRGDNGQPLGSQPGHPCLAAG